jgi:hypothetical protein
MDTTVIVVVLLHLAVTSGFAIKTKKKSSNGREQAISLKPSGGFQTPTSKTIKDPTLKSPPHRLHYIPDKSENTKRLTSWLEEEEVEGLHGTVLGFVPANAGAAVVTSPSSLKSSLSSTSPSSSSSSPSLSRGSQPSQKSFLRGIFADQMFSPNEYILAVPFVTTLLVQEEFEVSSPETSKVVNTASDEVRLLAGHPQNGLQFMRKFLMDDGDSEFAGESTSPMPMRPLPGQYQAYFDCIPMTTKDPNFDATPDFWTTEEIQQLEVPSVVQSTLLRKNAIQRLAEAVVAPTSGTTNKVDDFHSVLQHASWLVQTRAFTTYKRAVDLDGNEGLLSRVVLIPWMDFINSADSRSYNAELQVVETKAYDESFYALVATKPIPKGAEIRIRYGIGQETPLDLFVKYGFLPQLEEISDTDKTAMSNQLEGVSWSTSLQDDQARLDTDVGLEEPLRTILRFRILLKTIKLQS